MEMLEAGGMRVCCDAARPPDADNPRGYREWSRLAEARGLGSAMEDAVGAAVKVVIPRVFELPKGFAYDVLVVDRDLDEVGDSQEAMLRRQGKAIGAGDREAVEAGYRRWLDQMPALFARMPGVRWMRVKHHELMESPGAVVDEICAWLGKDLDRRAMVAVVDPGLYRQRRRETQAKDAP